MDTFSQADTLEFENRIYTQYLGGNDAARIVGVFFGRPESEPVSRQILPSLHYFDVRSGSHVDFFLAGYQRAVELDRVSEDGAKGSWLQAGVGEETASFTRVHPELDWFFSPRQFNNIRGILERKSTWRYSGGVELVLMNTRRVGNTDDYVFDPSQTIVMRLDELGQDGVAGSVGVLFESIFRYCEDPNLTDPISGLSDHLGLQAAGRSFKRVLLSVIPRGLGREFEKVAKWAVRDFSL